MNSFSSSECLSNKEFAKKVHSLSDHITQKLKELRSKHSDKIQEIKGTGILNGIILNHFHRKLVDY